MNTAVSFASLASASVIAAPSVVPNDSPDAELVALGVQLRALIAADKELDKQGVPLDVDAWETAEIVTGICADDVSNLGKNDRKSLCDAYFAAKAANGAEALCEQSEKLWGEISRLIDAIEALPVHTMPGVAAKALAAACANPHTWRHDDWDDERMQAFFKSIFTAAGEECPYKVEIEPSAPKPEAKKRWDGYIANAEGLQPNVPVVDALCFHAKAWDAAKKLDEPNADTSDAENIVKTENNAVHAIELAYAENIHAAALRAAYLASYWNDEIHEEGGQNAFPSLSAACWSFRQFLHID